MCFGAALGASVLAGQLRFGSIAALGAFTCEYAHEDVYDRNVVFLPGIAVGLAGCLAIGGLAGHRSILTPIVLGVTAFVVTCLCDAFAVPGPGMPIFVLLCAIGSNLPPNAVVTDGAGVLGVGLASAAVVGIGGLSQRSTVRHTVAGDTARRERPEVFTFLRSVSEWFTLRFVGSPTVRMALRVGVAVTAAGLIANGLGLMRSYWAMAAAAGVLGLGSYAAVSMDRSVHRVVGSLLGALFGAALIDVRPDVATLVLTLSLLVFVNEMVVTRNYAAGSVFIAAFVLVLTASASHGAPRAGLPQTFMEETAIGCASALVMGWAVGPRWANKQMFLAIQRTALAIEEAQLVSEEQRDNAIEMLRFRLNRLQLVAQRTGRERRTVRNAVGRYQALGQEARDYADRVLARPTDEITCHHADDLRTADQILQSLVATAP